MKTAKLLYLMYLSSVLVFLAACEPVVEPLNRLRFDGVSWGECDAETCELRVYGWNDGVFCVRDPWGQVWVRGADREELAHARWSVEGVYQAGEHFTAVVRVPASVMPLARSVDAQGWYHYDGVC